MTFMYTSGDILAAIVVGGFLLFLGMIYAWVLLTAIIFWVKAKCKAGINWVKSIFKRKQPDGEGTAI